jgi:hypothetical protein
MSDEILQEYWCLNGFKIQFVRLVVDHSFKRAGMPLHYAVRVIDDRWLTREVFPLIQEGLWDEEWRAIGHYKHQVRKWRLIGWLPKLIRNRLK